MEPTEIMISLKIKDAFSKIKIYLKKSSVTNIAETLHF